MKKWLVLFLIIDFIFIGLVLKLSNEKTRSIANLEQPTIDTNQLSEGQQRKLSLIQSLNFNINSQKISLKSNFLQAYCSAYSMIEVKFKALNQATAGLSPSISHKFSCENFRKDNSLSSLETPLQLFKDLQFKKRIELNGSLLISNNLFSDEEFPNEWSLDEIIFYGSSTFSISNIELQTVLTNQIFQFDITTFLK